MKQQFHAYLALRCQKQDLRTWFDPRMLSFNEKTLCVTVVFPHACFGAWFVNGPQALFTKAAQEFFEQHCQVLYENISRAQKVCSEKISLAQTTFMTGVTSDTDRNIKTAQKGHHEQKRPMAHREATFDSFIINHSNAFTLKTAKEAVRDALKTKQARHYNPILLYRVSGSGKNHLFDFFLNTKSKWPLPTKTLLV